MQAETIAARLRVDPGFATALFNEAIALVLNGEPETARLVLRDLVSATIGFEGLAIATANPVKLAESMRRKYKLLTKIIR
jgi:hypothetical protein